MSAYEGLPDDDGLAPSSAIDAGGDGAALGYGEAAKAAPAALPMHADRPRILLMGLQRYVPPFPLHCEHRAAAAAAVELVLECSRTIESLPLGVLAARRAARRSAR